ncbi:MAG: PaaI family thioesterase [Pedobacter sp.]
MEYKEQDVDTYFSVNLSGEVGWLSFDAPSLMGDSLRFVSGEKNGKRYRVHYYKDTNGQLCARIWFGPDTEGPRGHSHGGAIAAVLDEALSLAACARGFSAVMGHLSVRFRNMLPLEHVVTVQTEVMSVKGRRVSVRGRICLGKKIFAEAEGLCIVIS